MINLSELERLSNLATPGPWLRSHDPKKWVSTLAPVTSEEWRENADNDAALIVLLRNSLPAILTEIRELRELKERFSEAVDAYSRLWSKRTPSRDEYNTHFTPFILPAPDPLVEAIREMALTDATPEDADRLRAALAACGLEVRKIGEGE